MMKSNIDLTENEMFSRPSWDKIKNISRLKNRFPWDFNSTETQPKACKTIFTGNRKERMLKKLYSREADHCDRCGTSLVEIPWDRTYGLCKHCSIEIEQQVVGNKFNYPWIDM